MRSGKCGLGGVQGRVVRADSGATDGGVRAHRTSPTR